MYHNYHNNLDAENSMSNTTIPTEDDDSSAANIYHTSGSQVSMSDFDSFSSEVQTDIDPAKMYSSIQSRDVNQNSPENVNLLPRSKASDSDLKSRGGGAESSYRSAAELENQQQSPYFSTTVPPQQYGPQQPVPYGHPPPPPVHCYPYAVPPQQPRERGPNYTLIIVASLAVMSIVQISRGGFLAPTAANQQAYWANQNNMAMNNGWLRSQQGNGYMQGGAPGMMGNMNYQPNGGMGGGYGHNGQMMNNNMMGVMNGQQEGQQSMAGNGGNMDTAQQQQDQPANSEGDGAVVISTSDGTVEEQAGKEVSAEGAEEIPAFPLDDLSNFKDNWDAWDPSDVPMFFHIPKAGGSTVKDIIGTCHRFVMATETGITDGHADDKEIAVVYPGGGPKGQDRSPFVNVDTTTVEGIARAKEMGFADSGLADAVVTYFLYQANELFTPTAKGRIFTVFRHPIDRAISMFYYIQIADWEPTYDPALKEMTIEEYAKSPKIENNWLTRQLADQPEGDLEDAHLQKAMEVIRRKIMVGLMTDIETTMERFERFFRWTYHVNPENQEKCREKLLSGGSNSNSKNKKEKPKPGSEAWELLSWQNQYDLQLYEYIEQLFVEQGQFVEGIDENQRNKDATCCKCDPPTFPPEGFTCPLAILF